MVLWNKSWLLIISSINVSICRYKRQIFQKKTAPKLHLYIFVMNCRLSPSLVNNSEQILVKQGFTLCRKKADDVVWGLWKPSKVGEQRAERNATYLPSCGLWLQDRLGAPPIKDPSSVTPECFTGLSLEPGQASEEDYRASMSPSAHLDSYVTTKKAKYSSFLAF